MYRIILLALILLSLHNRCLAEDRLKLIPLTVGVGLIIAPLTYEDNDLTYNKAIELEGWSYAATDILGRFLPNQVWFMSPIIVGAFDIVYRTDEMDNKIDTDIAFRKLNCDLLGVVGRIVIDF